MGIIRSFFGQPSYTLENDGIKVAVTVQGGHLTAEFGTGKGFVNPFFVAPWWSEARVDEAPDVLSVLRGDFFCFPFGGGEDPDRKITYPAHGHTACDPWDFVSIEEGGGEKKLHLAMDLAGGEKIQKRILLRMDEPVVYIDHVIEGFRGKMPLGYHPTLKLPDQEGSGIIDMSSPITGFTPPAPFESPGAGGYNHLKPGTEITDRSKVPTMDGAAVDITRYPTPRGFEDLVMFISDPQLDFAYTAASVPENGYLYFQLKNPKVLAQTVFWMSNGGRHYAPWNGRVTSVLGMEEVTSFFHYGIQKSVENNSFREQGWNTAVDFDGKSSVHIKLIMGLVPVKKGFRGVEDIVRENEKTLKISGRGGKKIHVPCRVDFLQ
jgi:hypothetical protein